MYENIIKNAKQSSKAAKRIMPNPIAAIMLCERNSHGVRFDSTALLF